MRENAAVFRGFRLAAIGRIVVYWCSVRGHRGPEMKVARAGAVQHPRAGSASFIGACEHVHCSAPPRARRAPAPPAPAATVRHGKCSLHLSIGGTRYRLHPITPPPGFKAVWSLRKQSPESSAVYQVAVEKGRQPACTCPDFEIRGAVCKHIGSLKALGLIPGRKARPAAARRSHARRLAGRGARPGLGRPPAARRPSPAASPRASRGRQHLAMRRMAERIDGTPGPSRRPADPPCARLRRRRSTPSSPATRISAAPAPRKGPTNEQHIITMFVDRAGAHPARSHPAGRASSAPRNTAPIARSIILDHAAAGAPLADLTVPTPDGWVVLEPHDLAAAEEALRRGGPAPRVIGSGQSALSGPEEEGPAGPGRPSAPGH